jgi:hypothetical protein
VLSCRDFCDRLYDEDCRHALAGRGPLPTDVSVHHQECAGCRLVWAQAAEDLATLPRLLLEPMPAALLADLRVSVIKGMELPPTLDWTAAITWAAIGAVLPALAAVAGPLPSWLAAMGPLSLSLVGASFAFAANAATGALREAIG